MILVGETSNDGDNGLGNRNSYSSTNEWLSD